MDIVILFVTGLIIWYIYYGSECAINGAMTRPDNSWFIPFICLYEEIPWAIPFVGIWYRYNHVENLYIKQKNICLMCEARNLPGPIHFLIVHVLLPASPLLIYSVL